MEDARKFVKNFQDNSFHEWIVRRPNMKYDERESNQQEES